MDDEVENLDDIEHPFTSGNSSNENDGLTTEMAADQAKDVDNASVEQGVSVGSTDTGPDSEKPKIVGKFIPKHNEKALAVVTSEVEKQLSEASERSKSTAVEVFKVPDKPPPKKQRIVLEEDQYATDVEKIIQRDFFPDLEKLKAQNAYLSAMQNNDIHMLRELYSKYNLGKRTPRTGQTSALNTPTFFETPLGATDKTTPAVSEPGTPTHLPMENPADNDDAASVSSSKKSKSDRSDQSLNSYLDNYTSEDNKSFQDFMDEAHRKHKIKYSWLYDAEAKHAENMKNAIALPSMEEQAAEYKRPLDIETWEYRNQNYVMYVPEGVPFTVEEKMEQARKKKEIILQNTRFKSNPFKEVGTTSAETPSTAQQSGKVNLFKSVAGKIGVDGKEIESATPKVNGFSYVRTPSPNPVAEESPFMTWGEIEGTPFRLDGGDTPIHTNPLKPYKILEQSKRDKLGLELAEQVSQRYRDKKLKAIEAARSHLVTPSPRPQTVMERLSSMSPAAQRFAKAKLGSKLTGDKSLAQSYTPKRTPSSSMTPTPGKSSSKEKTPAYKTGAGTSRTPGSNTTPAFSTDNLLKLPGQDPKASSRPKASDYF